MVLGGRAIDPAVDGFPGGSFVDTHAQASQLNRLVLPNIHGVSARPQSERNRDNNSDCGGNVESSPSGCAQRHRCPVAFWYGSAGCHVSDGSLVTAHQASASTADHGFAPRLAGLRSSLPLLFLLTATTISRAVRLGQPSVLVFDEIFYVGDAVDVIDGGLAGVDAPHPMAGAQLLAVGIRLFGLEPWTWRLAPLVAGVLVVWLTVVAARRLGVRPWLALLAGGLVAFDGVAFVTGRLALLDGLAALPTTAVLALLAHGRRSAAQVGLIGVLLGAALAIKWTVVPLVVVAAIYAVGSNVGRRVATAAVVLAMATATYGVAHLEWFTNDQVALAQGHCEPDGCGLGARTAALVSEQAENFRFHRQLAPSNPSAAPVLAWPLSTEPTVLFHKRCTPEMAAAAHDRSDGVCQGAPTTAAVVALANPVLWIAGVAAAIFLVLQAVAAFVRKPSLSDSSAMGASPGCRLSPPWPNSLLAPAAILVSVVVFAAGGRDGFSFYAAPLVPAMALSLVVVIDRLPGRWPRVVGGATAALSASLFVWAWPVLAARPIGSGGPRRWLLDLLGL